MRRNNIISDYFSFTRRERIAVITLILLIALVYLAPGILIKSRSAGAPVIDSSLLGAIRKPKMNTYWDSTEEFEKSEPRQGGTLIAHRPISPKKPAGKLFYFDPNKISDTEWEKLGLRPKTVQTIRNYLSKGGRFRIAEDLKKMYGLYPDEYERIAPFISIANEPPKMQPGISEPGQIKARRDFYTTIDINYADTTQFISLPGIGSKLATRIIHFREKLGGFISIEQVGETFGLPDSTFQKIRRYLKMEPVTIRKININTATLDELKAHPYIKFSLAKPIISYREQHGAFSGLETLKNIMSVTDELYSKLVPYLTL